MRIGRELTTPASTGSTSELIDPQNIKSAILHDINLAEDFKSRYGLDDFDSTIIRESVLVNTGMTHFQSKHFVAGSQITPWRQVRQALMELETRYHAYFELQTSLRKAEVQRKMQVRAIDEETDLLVREMLQIDLDKMDYDITIWRRKLRQSEIEIDSFLKIVREHVKDEEDLKYFTEMNEDEERQYWVYRMGKQAALDIIAYGRIGSGNMDSIAMMEYDDQIEVLHKAIQYSGMINANVATIAHEVSEQVAALSESGRLELPLLQESAGLVQHSAQPQVTAERL